jgi:hypothetical protein
MKKQRDLLSALNKDIERKKRRLRQQTRKEIEL